MVGCGLGKSQLWQVFSREAPAANPSLKAALRKSVWFLEAKVFLAPKTYFIENSKNALRKHIMMSKLPAPYGSATAYGTWKKDGRVWSNVRGVRR